jgi:ABC-type branched-subunit amino acid transport system ATPase component
MHILETKHLLKRFEGVHAVDRLSLAFERGKITAVIGPNGSGKTTLVNLLSGMLPWDSGAVAIDGRVTLARLAPHEAPAYGITRTFQEVRLWNQMTVLDNLLVVLTERNVFSALFERHSAYHLERAEEILKRVGLSEKRHALAANLSYGQRKLLEIGRALAMRADILLLDEPFAGLFPEMVKTIVGIVRELRREGKTIVLIEHNMDLVRELADHVVVMDGGELLAEGRPAEVLAKKEVMEAYLGE